MNMASQLSASSAQKAKRIVRRVLARPGVSRAVTAAVKPWARSLGPGILLRIPVSRLVEVGSPLCPDPVVLDARGVDPVASMLYWHGLAGWEPETLPVFLGLVTPGRVVLDVGANTGLFSLLAARLSPKATVHAFEPVPRVFAMLQSNVARNALVNVVCHPLALTDSPGKVSMYVPSDEVPLMASTLPDWQPGSARIGVEATTVDRFVEDHCISDVDLIKIDTEGTEDQVIGGATRTLATQQPFVICEVLQLGNTAQRLDEQMNALGYQFFLLDEHGPVRTDRVRGAAIDACRNYLFVPQSRLEQAHAILGL